MIHAENHLSLKIDMTLKLSKDATLKAIPNDSEKYSILLISGVSNVTVTGGTLEGDRQDARDVSFCSVIADGNRRQSLSRPRPSS